jgi:hypothetical protein
LLFASWFLTALAYATNADAEHALLAAVSDDTDNETQQRLKDKRLRLDERRKALMLSYTSFVRPMVTDAAKYMHEADETWSSPAEQLRHAEENADHVLNGTPYTATVWIPSTLLLLLLVVVLWSMWSGLTRGGVMLWAAGIRLVQADGRRAARWRCAWRALLSCLPVALLLGLSLSVEGWRLMHSLTDISTTTLSMTGWVCWLAWWLGLATLLVQIWLVLRSPNRALHDRLAGTYLVPR